MGKWADMAENLQRRDKDQVEQMNGMFGDGPTIENMITLADGRAFDALSVLVLVLKHLDEQEANKVPNAKLSRGDTDHD